MLFVEHFTMVERKKVSIHDTKDHNFNIKFSQNRFHLHNLKTSEINGKKLAQEKLAIIMFEKNHYQKKHGMIVNMFH